MNFQSTLLLWIRNTKDSLWRPFMVPEGNLKCKQPPWHIALVYGWSRSHMGIWADFEDRLTHEWGLTSTRANLTKINVDRSTGQRSQRVVEWATCITYESSWEVRPTTRVATRDRRGLTSSSNSTARDMKPVVVAYAVLAALGVASGKFDPYVTLYNRSLKSYRGRFVGDMEAGSGRKRNGS